MKIWSEILFALGLVVVPLFASAEEQSLSVKVRDTRLRSQPKAWSPGIQTLTYGTKLTVVGTEEGWFKVKTSAGKQGFVHPSAVTDKVIILSNSSLPSAQPDSADVVLAGKGFSREVENNFAKTNPNLKFGELNQIEKLKISEGELVAFMRQGKLGGGAL